MKRIERDDWLLGREFFCPECDLLVLKHYAPSGDTVEVFSGQKFLAEKMVRSEVRSESANLGASHFICQEFLSRKNLHGISRRGVVLKYQ